MKTVKKTKLENLNNEQFETITRNQLFKMQGGNATDGSTTGDSTGSSTSTGTGDPSAGTTSNAICFPSYHWWTTNGNATDYETWDDAPWAS